MYKKFAIEILLCSMVFAIGMLSVKEIEMSRVASTPAFQLRYLDETRDMKSNRFLVYLGELASGQRVVDYEVLVNEDQYQLPEEEKEVLYRIVEAEAGCEDTKGRMLVAGVILNRMNNPKFPDTVKEVVFQQEDGHYQFSPISDGKYYSVEVTEDTIEAVDRVLAGEDVSEGALYFAARAYADPEKMAWFDRSLTKLFTYGGHEFFFGFFLTNFGSSSCQ